MERTEALAVLLALVPGDAPPDPLTSLLARPAWHEDAACRAEPLDVFFPVRGQSLAPARAVCSVCPVRSACLDWALDQPDNPEGVFAGTGRKQRVPMRRERRLARERRERRTTAA